MNVYAEAIVKYIEKEHSLKNVSNLTDLRFMDEGYVDSMGILHLIYNLESDFSVEFTDEELKSQEIRTIGGLANMLREKHNAL